MLIGLVVITLAAVAPILYLIATETRHKRATLARIVWFARADVASGYATKGYREAAGLIGMVAEFDKAMKG